MVIRLALVGENIEYSQSPAIFAAVFEQHKVDGEYEVCSVGAAHLSDEVRRLVDSGVVGFSVTTPHKESIMSLLDEIDPVARTIGAVNCVAVHGGRLVGYNTDWSGLAHSLEPHAAALDSCPALVVGAGGAARATIYTLWKAFDVGEFAVASRNPANVAALKNHLEAMAGRLSITPAEVPVDLELGGRTVVNCTPLGGPKFPELTPFSEAFDWSSVGLYCDLNYNRDNKLLAAALNAARPVVDGSQMLVAQALDAYEIWTGHRARISETYQKVFGVGRG